LRRLSAVPAGSGKIACVVSGGNLDRERLMMLAGSGATHD
jgi:hypothetical protein